MSGAPVVQQSLTLETGITSGTVVESIEARVSLCLAEGGKVRPLLAQRFWGLGGFRRGSKRLAPVPLPPSSMSLLLWCRSICLLCLLRLTRRRSLLRSCEWRRGLFWGIGSVTSLLWRHCSGLGNGSPELQFCNETDSRHSGRKGTKD